MGARPPSNSYHYNLGEYFICTKTRSNLALFFGGSPYRKSWNRPCSECYCLLLLGRVGKLWQLLQSATSRSVATESFFYSSAIYHHLHLQYPNRLLLFEQLSSVCVCVCACCALISCRQTEPPSPSAERLPTCPLPHCPGSDEHLLIPWIRTARMMLLR